MFDFIASYLSADVINDPGTIQLLAGVEVKDVPKGSVLVIPQGRGCIWIQNGKLKACEKPGKYYLEEGTPRVLNSFQTTMYKGQSPNPNAFWYYDTINYVYRDLMLDIGALIVQDNYSNTKVEVTPRIVVEINVKNVKTLYHAIKGYGFGNQAIAIWLGARMGPEIKAYIYEAIRKSNSLYDCNNHLNNIFSRDFKHEVASFLEKQGIMMNDIHVISLGMSEEVDNNRQNTNEMTMLCNKVQLLANQLNLEPRQAMQYILASDALKQKYVMNPLQMEIARKIADGSLDLL